MAACILFSIPTSSSTLVAAAMMFDQHVSHSCATIPQRFGAYSHKNRDYAEGYKPTQDVCD